ncbi:MAG: hypothetical protein ORO03_02270, partial [Alphaproteobacteria bacterium]|nr:hypothetical protein [Alphaproteobacteria bacterium]
ARYGSSDRYDLVMDGAAAVTVASLAQAREAAAAAVEFKRRLMLVSVAGQSGGWFAKLLSLVRGEFTLSVVGILDCGTQPGRVLESLTLPLDGVVFLEAQAPGGVELGARLRLLLTAAGRAYLVERPAAISLVRFRATGAASAHLRREWLKND